MTDTAHGTWKRAGVLLVTGALVLAGCGRDAPEATPQASATDVTSGPATGSVVVWAMGAEGEKLGQLAKAFEAENPGVTVKVTAIPWDSAFDKISTSIAGGQTPDVSLVGTTWMGAFAATKALDPTPALIDAGTFFDGAWNTTVVDGTSYGVPWYVETRLLYYRADLAKKAGLAPPTTWAELKTFVQGLQKAGAEHGISLPAGGTGSWQTFLPFAWQNGAELTKGDAWDLSTPAMQEALTYYTSYFTEGLTPTDLEPGELEAGFVKGSIGSFISGPWHMGILKEQGGAAFKGKWGVAPMPKEQKGTSFVGGGDLVVFKDAQSRDAAWKFVAYLSQPKVQQTFYGLAAALPSVRSAWEGGELAADPLLATFGKQLDDTQSPPVSSTWEQVADVIDGEVEKATKAGLDPKAATAAMQSGATSIGMGH